MNVSQETVEDFSNQNHTSTSLAAKFEVPVKYQLVSASDVDRLFRSPRGWQQFYSRFPEAKGLISLSRVGFSSTKAEALVHVSIGCDFTCRNGKLIFLAKRKGRWYIQSRMITYLS